MDDEEEVCQGSLLSKSTQIKVDVIYFSLNELTLIFRINHARLYLFLFFRRPFLYSHYVIWLWIYIRLILFGVFISRIMYRTNFILISLNISHRNVWNTSQCQFVRLFVGYNITPSTINNKQMPNIDILNLQRMTESLAYTHTRTSVYYMCMGNIFRHFSFKSFI